jgi:hypothetical protein
MPVDGPHKLCVAKTKNADYLRDVATKRRIALLLPAETLSQKLTCSKLRPVSGEVDARIATQLLRSTVS